MTLSPFTEAFWTCYSRETILNAKHNEPDIHFVRFASITKESVLAVL